MIRTGVVSGICGRCGKEIYGRHPERFAYCGCWEYCPNDHGVGPYGTKMEVYTPDMTPSTYRPIGEASGAWGDLKNPMEILRVCPVCGYHSAKLPAEVELT